MASISENCVTCKSTNLSKSPAILMPFIADRVFGWKPFEIVKDHGMKSLKEGNVYSICNSVLCFDCHHLFLDLRFNDYEMNKLYSNYRENDYIQQREKYEPGYSKKNEKLNKGYKYLKKIEDFIRTKCKAPQIILDWGGGSGVNTPFKNSANEIYLYDISYNSKDQNNFFQDNIKVLDSQMLTKKKIDLVCSMNVFEHLSWPIEELNKIKKNMSKETFFYFEIPYENLIKSNHTFIEKLNKKIHWHEHINFFNEKSIRALFNICGFRILNLKILNEPYEYGVVFQVLSQLDK